MDAIRERKVATILVSACEGAKNAQKFELMTIGLFGCEHTAKRDDTPNS
jgi:hypothetical protein